MVQPLSSRYRDDVWLRMSKKPRNRNTPVLRTVDLFAGCGGLALGVAEACRRMKLGHFVEFANEWDEDALNIFETNLRPRVADHSDIEHLFDGSIEDFDQATEVEQNLLNRHPSILTPDLLTGGPPCQGHSDLNNHSRRNDPRNSLYLRMVRAAAILRPKAIIIENVSTVIHAKEGVVQQTQELLGQLGYHVSEATLWANEFGVPQSRKRHFLLASSVRQPDLSLLEPHRMAASRTLRWAIEDLTSETDPKDPYNAPANSNDENQARMNWLVENGEYDLPNHLRPKCHQNGHNYPAVYGRMHWDEPSSTITKGFRSNGQGRFTHPSAYPGRTLTAHEAARIQTFPDWFSFAGHRPTTMSKTIGNAVPPLLAMYVASVAIQSIIE